MDKWFVDQRVALAGGSGSGLGTSRPLFYGSEHHAHHNMAVVAAVVAAPLACALLAERTNWRLLSRVLAGIG